MDKQYIRGGKMSKEYKITFKKYPSPTGLEAVGAGTPSVDIKYKGEVIGRIDHNDHWNSKDVGIQIYFKAKRNKDKITSESPLKWYWGLWKASPFPDEKTAREKCQEYKDWILSIVYRESEG